MRIAVKNNIMIVIGVIMMLLLVYYLFDPLENNWMPQCIFYKVTGLQCMGCGSQRVIHSLMHGDIEGAFRANALLVISLPFIIFLLLLEIFRNRYAILYRKIHTRTTIIFVAGIMIGWFIFRNFISI